MSRLPPTERMKELQTLPQMYEVCTRQRTELAAQNEALKSALEGIQRYGLDTLSGRSDGPDDRNWQRDGVNEMTKRARVALAIPNLSPEILRKRDESLIEKCANACLQYRDSLNNTWNRGLGVAKDLIETCEECAEVIRAMKEKT